MAQGAQWKVIHMAHSEKNAKEILALLEREGFLARSKQVYRRFTAPFPLKKTIMKSWRSVPKLWRRSNC